MRVFVARVHPISSLITMNIDAKLGLEIAASNAIGWVLVGPVKGVVYRPLMPSSTSTELLHQTNRLYLASLGGENTQDHVQQAIADLANSH